MKKTFGDYVMGTIQAIIVSGVATAMSYWMYQKMMKKIFKVEED